MSETRQVIVASGKPRRGYYFSIGPGACYALRFTPPAGHVSLSSLQLRFQPFGNDTAKVQVRIRVASLAATGGPAEDDVLPTPVLLTVQTLQLLREPLVLTWLAGQVPLPAAGFFVVVEGVGDTPDEYVAGLSRPWAYSYNGYYQIGRRQQPAKPPRLLNRLSIPLLPGAKAVSPSTSFWTRGGDQPEWQATPTPKVVPLLEVGFY